MQEDDALLGQGKTAASLVSERMRNRLGAVLAPFLSELDEYLDRRLLRTLLLTVEAVLAFRNRASGLLLSELGGYLLSADHAPAGTKRLSNLLRSSKWTSVLIEAHLWRQADEKRQQLVADGQTALVLWDESVQERPESIASPDLGSVRSSKAHRLTRIKPGYYTPPSRPIFVPGFRWLSLLLCGRSGPPLLLPPKRQAGPDRSDPALQTPVSPRSPLDRLPRPPSANSGMTHVSGIWGDGATSR